MSCRVMNIYKKSLVPARFFFYPKSPYSFLRYFFTSVSNCFDLLILYFVLTFSSSLTSSGGNVIFILFLSFFSSKPLTPFFFLYTSKILFYVYKVKFIHKFLHNAQCTPRGGRSTPLGLHPSNSLKKDPFLQGSYHSLFQFPFMALMRCGLKNLRAFATES